MKGRPPKNKDKSDFCTKGLQTLNSLKNIQDQMKFFETYCRGDQTKIFAMLHSQADLNRPDGSFKLLPSNYSSLSSGYKCFKIVLSSNF
jgi:hypothetical protein